MRIFAVIVGLLAMAFGGGCLMLVYPSFGLSGLFLGWLPLIAGCGLLGYAVFRGGATPFPRAARAVVWAFLAGLAVYAVFVLYVLATLKIH